MLDCLRRSTLEEATVLLSLFQPADNMHLMKVTDVGPGNSLLTLGSQTGEPGGLYGSFKQWTT